MAGKEHTQRFPELVRRAEPVPRTVCPREPPLPPCAACATAPDPAPPGGVRSPHAGRMPAGLQPPAPTLSRDGSGGREGALGPMAGWRLADCSALLSKTGLSAGLRAQRLRERWEAGVHHLLPHLLQALVLSPFPGLRGFFGGGPEPAGPCLCRRCPERGEAMRGSPRGHGAPGRWAGPARVGGGWRLTCCDFKPFPLGL